MISNLDTEGLSKIAFDYDLFYIDIWGVIHNGLELNLSAVETLKHLKENNQLINSVHNLSQCVILL